MAIRTTSSPEYSATDQSLKEQKGQVEVPKRCWLDAGWRYRPESWEPHIHQLPEGTLPSLLEDSLPADWR